jgi:hypothetical protein
MELTPDELERATLLRALEWGHMPLFATQILVPASFLFFGWWQVPIALVVATWLWHPMKYALASYRTATVFCLINSPLLRWPLGLGFGVLYFSRGQYLTVAVAVLWPLIVLMLMPLCPRTQFGTLQRVFAAQALSAARQ